jgi:hypothetical protein
MTTQTQIKEAALLQNAIITCVQKAEGPTIAPDALVDPDVRKFARDGDHVSTVMSNLYFAGMLDRVPFNSPTAGRRHVRWAYLALQNPRPPVRRNVGKYGPRGARNAPVESADFTIKVRIGDKVVELTFDQSRDLYRQLKKLHGGNDG